MNNKFTLYEGHSDKTGVMGYFTLLLRIDGQSFSQAGYLREYSSTIQREQCLKEARLQADKILKTLGIKYEETLIDWNPKPKPVREIVLSDFGVKITVEKI